MEQNNNDSYVRVGDVLLPYVQKLWGTRRNIVLINGIVLFIAIAYQFVVVKPYFESTITILPDYGNSNASTSALAGLAAIAGVSVGNNSSPSDIYKNLLTSESVIEPVVYAKYRSNEFKDSVTLIEYFGITIDNSLDPKLQQREVFLSVFKIFNEGIISVKSDPQGILTVTVRMNESRLSSAVVNNLVRSLDSYVRTKSQTNASVQRIFIENRLTAVNDSLFLAEESLKNFQLNNRAVSQSPALLLEQSRINRRVLMLQGIVAALTQQYEIAKINEIKDLPIINVREWSRDPIRKAGPQRLYSVIITFFASFVLTLLFFIVKDHIIAYVNLIMKK